MSSNTMKIVKISWTVKVELICQRGGTTSTPNWTLKSKKQRYDVSWWKPVSDKTIYRKLRNGADALQYYLSPKWHCQLLRHRKAKDAMRGLKRSGKVNGWLNATYYEYTEHTEGGQRFWPISGQTAMDRLGVQQRFRYREGGYVGQ